VTVDLAHIRQAVAQATAVGLTERAICRLLGIDRVQLRRMAAFPNYQPEAKTMQRMAERVHLLPSPENPTPWKRRKVDQRAVMAAINSLPRHAWAS
jgi:hypothetical protein